MARFSHVLATTLQEQGISERDARIAAGLLMSVHRQFFRAARQRAIEGTTGPAALRQLKTDLARAYELLDGGLATVFA
jgi:hypothetical protein